MEATIVYYPICKVSLQSVSIQGRDCGTCHIKHFVGLAARKAPGIGSKNASASTANQYSGFP